MSVQDTEDYKKVIAEALAAMPIETRIAGIAPEEMLARVPPEQRLAGLTQAERLLAMPDEALRALSEDYLRTLPTEIVATIRERIGRPSVH